MRAPALALPLAAALVAAALASGPQVEVADAEQLRDLVTKDLAALVQKLVDEAVASRSPAPKPVADQADSTPIPPPEGA